MMISIQNTQVLKITPNISLRLKEEEFERYKEIAENALDRHPYVRTADLVRELLGLRTPSILSSVEVDYFRTGKGNISHQSKPNSVPTTKIRVGDTKKLKQNKVG